jgi:tRNA pseudouridine38-40 synthase
MVSVRLRVDLEYDGTDFAGWQVQPGCRTVQGELVQAFSTVVRRPVRVVGAGRTDAGVHARGQVAHVDLPLDGVERVPPLGGLFVGVNALTGRDVAIREITCAPGGFHARFSAKSRTYRYRIASRPVALNRALVWSVRRHLDRSRMEGALAHLLGRYPATSWCAAHSSERDAVVEVRCARFVEESQEVLALEITADRFVTHMVRTIVGTLAEIGWGRREPDGIRELIDARDRRLAGPTAPACGLCLEHVEY